MKQRNANKRLEQRTTAYEQALKSKDGSARHMFHKPGSRKRA